MATRDRIAVRRSRAATPSTAPPPMHLPGSVAHSTHGAGRVRRRRCGPDSPASQPPPAGATGPSRRGPRCRPRSATHGSRRRWPEAERDAFDAVLGALDRLADAGVRGGRTGAGRISPVRRRRARRLRWPGRPLRGGRAVRARSAPPSASTWTPSSSWDSPRASAPCRGGRTRCSPIGTVASRSTASSPCVKPRSRTSGGATSPRSPPAPATASSSAPRGDLRTGASGCRRATCSRLRPP